MEQWNYKLTSHYTLKEKVLKLCIFFSRESKTDFFIIKKNQHVAKIFIFPPTLSNIILWFSIIIISSPPTPDHLFRLREQSHVFKDIYLILFCEDRLSCFLDKKYGK